MPEMGIADQAEKLGALKGEVTALVREFQDLRIEIRAQNTTCIACQSSQLRQIAEFATQLSNHIVSHKTSEGAEIAHRTEATADIAGHRWSWQILVMAIGIFLSFAVSVTTLLHSWG